MVPRMQLEQQAAHALGLNLGVVFQTPISACAYSLELA